MATAVHAPGQQIKAGKEGFHTQKVQHRIRITLCSKAINNLEKGKHLRPLSAMHEFFFLTFCSEL
jgi:hypothetical protein